MGPYWDLGMLDTLDKEGWDDKAVKWHGRRQATVKGLSMGSGDAGKTTTRVAPRVSTTPRPVWWDLVLSKLRPGKSDIP